MKMYFFFFGLLMAGFAAAFVELFKPDAAAGRGKEVGAALGLCTCAHDHNCQTSR